MSARWRHGAEACFFGPTACKQRDTWLIDFPLVVLVVNRLRTPRARRFHAASLEQSLLVMAGREDVARSLALYWRQERMQRPDDTLLQFMGAVVDHQAPPEAAEEQAGPRSGVVEERVARACRDYLEKAIPKFVDALAVKFQDVLVAPTTAERKLTFEQAEA